MTGTTQRETTQSLVDELDKLISVNGEITFSLSDRLNGILLPDHPAPNPPCGVTGAVPTAIGSPINERLRDFISRLAHRNDYLNAITSRISL